MLNIISFQFLEWKIDVYNIPPLISVIQTRILEYICTKRIFKYETSLGHRFFLFLIGLIYRILDYSRSDENSYLYRM